MVRIRNNRGGTGIAELGPALFVLIIVIFIPICDLLAMTCSYVAGYLLNSTMARECACKDPTDATGSGAGLVNVTAGVKIADTAWKSNVLIAGLAQARNATTIHAVTFVNNKGTPVGTCTFTCTPPSSVAPSGSLAIPAPTIVNGNYSDPNSIYVATCQVVTQIPITPLFVVPFIGNVPGLSAPITFVYSCQRPQEEKGVQ
jgi:hypothetical protein